MPVPTLVAAVMDSLKSAELIRELKAETEKLVETSSMVAKDDPDEVTSLEASLVYESKPNHFVTLKRNVIPYPDHNYGQQPPLTPPEQASPDPNEQTDTGNEDEDEEGVTRCICGFDHDDGYMICCDRCGSWQHIDCMGIKSDSVPETYHCDRCEPRQLDVERARAIQQRKKDTLTDDDGDDDTDTDEDAAQTYTAISQTPTRITLTANAVLKKKGKNRLKSTSSEGKTKKRKKVNRKRQRTSIGTLNESILQIDSNSIESQIGPDTFQEIGTNLYDPAVTCLALQDTENCTDAMPVDEKKVYVVGEVAENRLGLIATEDIKAGQFISEYKGKVLLAATYEESNPFFKRACPFLLHYNKIDQLELVVDARQTGNGARYIRRSCTPNAEVSHLVKGGNIHIMITTKHAIGAGSEITIPFEYQIETYPGYVDCACKDPLCLIIKHNQPYLPASGRKRSRFSVTDPHSSTRNSASENQGETDSDDNDLDGTQSVSRRKKLSREERKLQAYLKQIEKMEKKEKKVKDPKVTPSRSVIISEASQTPGPILPRSTQSLDSSTLLQSPASSVQRRITSCTPGSGKKRLSVNRKRPRIASCSSDPLSPEVSICTITTVNTTSLQEQIVCTQPSLDYNGQLKQKPRRERDNLTLSVTVDKTLPNFRDHTRRQRKEYLEAAAGSPTPPSTPGQLSPPANQSALSVDTSSNLASPVGPLLSMQDRRSMLNGLLQIVEHRDNNVNCSLGPHNSVITSNGVVTAEEVMGEVVARESVALTPTGDRPTRKITKECRYFGSLKKRWLAQYENRKFSEMRPRNGVSPASLSNLFNDFSIQKRAEQIASYVFKTPKSCIPLKKRRLREMMLNSQNRNKEVNDVSGDSLSEHTETNEPVKSVTFNPLGANFDASDFGPDVSTKSTSAINPAELRNEDGGHLTIKSRECDSIGQGRIAPKSKSAGAESNAEEKPVMGTELLKEFQDHGKKKSGINGVDLSSTIERLDLQKMSALHGFAIVPEGKENSLNLRLDKLSTTLPCEDVSSISRPNQSPDSQTGSYVLAGNDSDLSQNNSDSNSAVKSLPNPDGCIPVHTNKDLSTSTPNQSEANRTSADKSDINSNTTLSKSDTISAIGINEENQMVKPDLTGQDPDFSHVANDLQAKASSILRDPRLSSSSSRSSRDSFDGQMFARSDSVSSLEDSSLQRPGSDRKQSIEKYDGTPNTKKKMSLREYRNRKKSKPLSNNMASSHETLVSKALNTHQSMLLTDTDSLLTPRTLSLSIGFGSVSGRDSGLVTAPERTPAHSGLVQQLDAEAVPNGQIFEPVSPGDDFCSADITKQRGRTTDAMDLDEESSPSACKTIIGLPKGDSIAISQYAYCSPQHHNIQGSNSVYQMQQVQSVGKTKENHVPVYRQTPNHNQHFHG